MIWRGSMNVRRSRDGGERRCSGRQGPVLEDQQLGCCLDLDGGVNWLSDANEGHADG